MRILQKLLSLVSLQTSVLEFLEAQMKLKSCPVYPVTSVLSKCFLKKKKNKITAPVPNSCLKGGKCLLLLCFNLMFGIFGRC